MPRTISSIFRRGRSEPQPPPDRPAELADVLSRLEALQSEYRNHSKESFGILKRKAPILGIMGSVPGLRRNSEKAQGDLIGPADRYSERLTELAGRYMSIGQELAATFRSWATSPPQDLAQARRSARTLRDDVKDGSKEIRMLRGAFVSAGGSRNATERFQGACSSLIASLSEVDDVNEVIAESASHFLLATRDSA